MNIEQGLVRTSVVLWGMVAAVFFIALASALLYDDRDEMLYIGASGLVVCFVAHKITKWVIQGFFSAKS